MIEKLLAGIIPLMLAKVTELPVEEKKHFAQFVSDMCSLYLTDDKPAFNYWLTETGLPETLQQGLAKALWHEGSAKNDHGMRSIPNGGKDTGV